MQIKKDNYLITDNSEAINIDFVTNILQTTYWAKDRSIETIEKSIEHSICFSLFKNTQQIGFARVITDFATFGYLADVVIDENYRNKGLGKWFVETIITDKRWDSFFLMLATKDAHKLYEKYGFNNTPRLMGRFKKLISINFPYLE